MSKEVSIPKPKMIIFELLEQQNSSFLKEGTDNDFLKAPSKRIVLNKGIEVQKSGNSANATVKHVRLRYIKGCSFLEVERQDKEGWKPSITGADTIEFEFGYLNLIDQGDDLVKAEFLRRVVFNEDHEGKIPGVQPLWREVKEEKKAEEAMKDFLIQSKIRDFVEQIASVKGDEVVYNQSLIDRYLLVAGVSADDFDSYAEKAVWLKDHAVAKGESFINTLALDHSAVVHKVKLCMKHGLISIFDKKATFSGDAGDKFICKIKTSASEDQVDELVKFLMYEPEGIDISSHISVLVQKIEQDGDQ